MFETSDILQLAPLVEQVLVAEEVLEEAAARVAKVVERVALAPTAILVATEGRAESAVPAAWVESAVQAVEVGLAAVHSR